IARADRPRHQRAGVDRDLGRLLGQHALEVRIALDVGARRTLPGAAKAGEPLLEIEEEAVLHLLAVIADVDADGGLPGDDPAHRFAAQPRDRARVDRLSALPIGVERGELAPARQAAGVGRQDAVGIWRHALPLWLSSDVPGSWIGWRKVNVLAPGDRRRNPSQKRTARMAAGG